MGNFFKKCLPPNKPYLHYTQPISVTTTLAPSVNYSLIPSSGTACPPQFLFQENCACGSLFFDKNFTLDINEKKIKFSHNQDVLLNNGQAFIVTTDLLNTTTTSTTTQAPDPVIVLLLNMEGDNESIIFTDSSISPKTVTEYNGAIISTTQKKFGNSSCLLNGNDSFLEVDSVSLDDDDFTIEAFVYLNGLQTCAIVNQGNSDSSGNYCFGITSNGAPFFYADNNDRIICETVLSINQWYHVALTRSNNTYRIFINGIQSGLYVGSHDHFGSPMKIGNGYGGIVVLDGYIDDLRIMKGLAFYTSNFTPPLSQLQSFLPSTTTTTTTTITASLKKLNITLNKSVDLKNRVQVILRAKETDEIIAHKIIGDDEQIYSIDSIELCYPDNIEFNNISLVLEFRSICYDINYNNDCCDKLPSTITLINTTTLLPCSTTTTTTTPPPFCSRFNLPNLFYSTVTASYPLESQERVSLFIKSGNVYSTSGTFPCGSNYNLSMTCDPTIESFYYDGAIDCCDQLTKTVIQPTKYPVIIPNIVLPSIISYTNCDNCPPPCTSTTTSTTIRPDCCNWDGNTTLTFGEMCDNLSVPIKFYKIDDNLWECNQILECGDKFNAVIKCNPLIVADVAALCKQKWQVVTFKLICASNARLTGNLLVLCECNKPPIFQFIADSFNNCFCCEPCKQCYSVYKNRPVSFIGEIAHITTFTVPNNISLPCDVRASGVVDDALLLNGQFIEDENNQTVAHYFDYSWTQYDRTFTLAAKDTVGGNVVLDVEVCIAPLNSPEDLEKCTTTTLPPTTTTTTTATSTTTTTTSTTTTTTPSEGFGACWIDGICYPYDDQSGNTAQACADQGGIYCPEVECGEEPCNP